MADDSTNGGGAPDRRPPSAPPRRAGRGHRGRAAALTAVVGLLGLVVALVAPATASAAGTATLGGTVTSAGTPTAAFVQIYRADVEQLVLTTGAATDGTWTAAVAPGTYRVKVWPGGAGLPATWYPGAPAWLGGGNVTVADGAAAVVDLDVVPGGAVTGTVTYAGVPAAGANVAVAWKGQRVRWAVTGADGSYRLEGLPPGPYVVNAWDPTTGHVTRWYPAGRTAGDAVEIPVTSGADQAGIDLDLPAAGAVTGRIVDQTGAPMAGLPAVAVNGFGAGQGVGITDASGRYLISGLTPGAVKVRLWDPTGNLAGYYAPAVADLWGAPSFSVRAGTVTTVPDLVSGLTTDIPPPPYQGDPAAPTVAVVGDSITQLSTTRFVERLRTAWSVSVQGFSGLFVGELAPNATRYAATEPDQVVINLGSNDAHELVPTAQSVADMQALIGLFPEADCIHLTTITTSSGLPSTTDGGHRLNDELRAMALADPRVRIIDWAAAVAAHQAAGNPGGSWTFDGIHPSTAGREALVGMVETALAACDSPPGAIDGTAFVDHSSDGTRQVDEPGQAAVLARAWRDLDGDGTFETVARRAASDDQGRFLLSGLAPDDYRVTVDPPTDPPATAPADAVAAVVTAGAVATVDLPVTAGTERYRQGLVLDGTGATEVRDLEVRPDGSVVVAGHFFGTLTLGSGASATSLTSAGRLDGFVALLDPLGEPVWAERFGSSADDEVFSLDAAADGTVAVVGSLQAAGTISDGAGEVAVPARSSALVAVFEPTGGLRWWRSASGAPLSMATAVSFDDAGHVVTATTFAGTVTPQGGPTIEAEGTIDTVLTANDAATGHLDWLTRLPGPPVTVITGLEPFGSGRLVASGVAGDLSVPTTTGSLALHRTGIFDIAALTLDTTTGTVVTGRLLGSPGADQAWRSAVDPATGDLYLTGSFGTSTEIDGTTVTATDDPAVIALGPDLSLRWVEVLPSVAANPLTGVAVADGRVHAVATFSAPVTVGGVVHAPVHARDGLVLELTTGGAVVGADVLAGGIGDETLVDVDRHPSGWVLVGGSFHGTARMGSGADAVTVTGSGLGSGVIVGFAPLP